MKQDDKRLLENVFDSLDRLFDRESKVLDVYQILYATDKAIGNHYVEFRLSTYARELEKIVRGNGSEESQRELALMATDSLRKTLNEHL